MKKNDAGATSGLAAVPQHGVLRHLGARRVVPGIIINVMIMMMILMMVIVMRSIINLSLSVFCNLRRRNPAEVRLSQQLSLTKKIFYQKILQRLKF